MNDATWHASPALMERYAVGDISDAAAYSVEAHLVGCEQCRLLVADQVPGHRTEVVWDRILDELDAPQAGAVERLLRRIGVPDHTARLVAATPTLRLSWLLAVAATLLFAVVAAHVGPGDGALFLILAPLLPLAGVAGAYGRAFDPTAEISKATPTSGVHLLVVRSTAVLLTTVGLTLVASFAVPGGASSTVGWLLPALGLTTAALAVGTVVDTGRAAIGLAAAWVAGTSLSIGSSMSAGDALSTAARDVVAYRPTGQLAFLALGLIAAAVLVARRDAFELEVA